MYRRLYRSRVNRHWAGVCGGLGEYFSIDPTVLRLVWLVAAIASFGAAVLVYFLAMLVIPEQPRQRPGRDYDARHAADSPGDAYGGHRVD